MNLCKNHSLHKSGMPVQQSPFGTCDFHLKKPCVQYMLWFKSIISLKFFELVSILFAIVPDPDYGNEYTTKENTN